MDKKSINKGVYIVVDPALELPKLLAQLEKIKVENLAAIQIWDNPNAAITREIIESICHLFKDTNTPILINNRWEYLKTYALDGVHFDSFPTNLEQINKELDRDFIKGITLTNDLKDLTQLERLGFDYLSFCSVFPSSTSNSCDLVAFETVKSCSENSSIPIFLSGGIKPENISQLQELNFDGVAVVSGIMKATNPLEAIEKYKHELNQSIYETANHIK